MIVILDADSIRLSESKISDSVFARIYLQYDVDRYFPECGWDDFVEIILEWWLDSAINLIKHKETSVFRFMDGDFSFQIHMVGENSFFVELQERSSILFAQEFDFVKFCQSLVAACNLFLRRMQEICGDREVLGALDMKLNIIRNLLKSLKFTS